MLKYFWNSLRRPYKMKGEIWQYKFPYLLSLLVENRLKINHCPGTWEEDSSNDHSPLERGQYVLERVFRYCYYGSVNALASVPGFRRFRQSEKKKKIAVLFIKHTCNRTINLQFFLQDPPVFYQEKRTNIATENHFFFFFFFVILNYMHFMATFDVKERRNPG